MPMDLHDLADLVSNVARDLGIHAEVVGVSPAEGDGYQAEVIVDIQTEDADAQRVSVSLQRDRTHQDLRAQVAEELRAALGR